MKAKNKIQKIGLYCLIAYKYLINTARIWIAMLFLFYRGNLTKIAFYLGNVEIVESSKFLLQLLFRLEQFRTMSVILFAMIFTVISMAEIVFITALLRKRKWGLIGLIIVSALWLPFEIVLFTAFFSITKLTIFAINIFILLFLIHFLRNVKFFRK